MKREAWRPYIAFGFIAAAIAAYSAIPALILYVIGGKTVSNSVYEIALTLALFVFILSRVLLTGELIEDKRSPIAAAFIENAEKREQELHPEPQPVVEITGESLVDDEDESQITIDDVAEAEEEDEISVEIIIEDEPVSTEEEE